MRTQCASDLNLEIATIMKPEMGAPVGLNCLFMTFNSNQPALKTRAVQGWVPSMTGSMHMCHNVSLPSRRYSVTGSAEYGAQAKLSTSKRTLTLIKSEKGLLERDLCCRTSQHVLHISEMICRKRLHRWKRDGGEEGEKKKQPTKILGISALFKVAFWNPTDTKTLQPENCSVHN